MEKQLREEEAHWAHSPQLAGPGRLEGALWTSHCPVTQSPPPGPPGLVGTVLLELPAGACPSSLPLPGDSRCAHSSSLSTEKPLLQGLC